jgi:hypothetical protein
MALNRLVGHSAEGKSFFLALHLLNVGENASACHFHYNEGHQGSLQDCGECRRFFGEDEFKRRREGPGNEALS